MINLKIVIVTQEDELFIPNIIKKIARKEKLIVKQIVVINSSGALENRKGYILKTFGFLSIYRLALKHAISKALNYFDILFSCNLLKEKKSIFAISRKYAISYMETNEINSRISIEWLAQINPDLIISFSAPQTFNQEILSLPRYGVLNVHGSYLPYYRGILPSFWVLANGEKYTGVTVHRMAEKIDEGDILLQKKVDISDCRTVLEVISKTKQAGGELILEAIQMYQDNPGNVQFKENKIEEGKYFSWPNKEDVKRFHKRGYRFA